jgi:hypothetical protein
VGGKPVTDELVDHGFGGFVGLFALVQSLDGGDARQGARAFG